MVVPRRAALRTVLALMVCALLAAGCVASVTGGPRRSGYLVVALAEAPDSLDPTLASSYVGRIVFANMCEKLYDVNSDLEVVPQLASELPQISEDGRTYTIPLRQGVKFNDGTPMTAQAVAGSLQRHKNNKLSQRSSELGPVESIRTVDGDSVRIELSRPFAPLVSVLADRSGMVLSPQALQRYGDDFGRNPVCVGPFSFQSRPSADEINLKRSQYYYNRSRVTLAGVTFRAVTEGSVRAANLRSGDVDIVDRAAPQDLEALRDDPALRVRSVTSLGYQGITINIGNANGTSGKTKAPPDSALAQHRKLRKAFELALDRDVINTVAFNGAYQPDCSPLPKGRFYTEIDCPERDVAAARKLIAEAGVTTPVPVTLTVENSAQSQQLGTLIQAMAADAGFRVSVQPTEFATALDRAKKGNIEAFQVGWSGRLDPDQNISPFVLPGSALNYAGINDPKVTSMVDAARQATDPAGRKRIYHQLVGYLNEKRGIIYLYHERYAMAYRAEISGIDYFGDGLIRLAGVRMGDS